jgi:integrase
MANSNHPPKGSIIKAEPLTSLAMIAAVEAGLATNLRDLAAFILGTNTNLRAVDLSRRKIGEVRGARVGSVLTLREKKTQKVRQIYPNGKVCRALNNWVAVHPWAEDDDAPLFPNLRSGKPLQVSSFSRMVKRWCLQAGLVGHYSAHTLRKTFGYTHRKTNGTDIPTRVFAGGVTRQGQLLT